MFLSYFQACTFALWLKKDIQEIADTPRLHHQLVPNYILYQTGFDLVGDSDFMIQRLFIVFKRVFPFLN